MPWNSTFRMSVLLLLATILQSNRATGDDVIAPGMTLAASKQVLQRHGYDLDSRKYGLAMIADDPNLTLEFVGIDDQITLVLTIDRSAARVNSLGVYFFPLLPSLKKGRPIVMREALEIRFEGDDVYVLKMKRKPTEAAAKNAAPRQGLPLLTSRSLRDAYVGKVVTLRGEVSNTKIPMILGIDIESVDPDLRGKLAEATGLLEKYTVTPEEIKGAIRVHRGPGTFYRLKDLHSDYDASVRPVSNSNGEESR